MMKRSHLALATIAGGFLLLGLVGAHAAGTLIAKPTPVAVVELDRLFNSLKQKAAFEAEQTAIQTELLDAHKEKENAVKVLGSDLEMLTPGTQDFIDKQREAELAVIELQIWSRFQEQQATRNAALEYEKLYREILDAVARIAEETGYELVLYKDGEPNFRYENFQQLIALMANRKVLYAADTIDITDEVIRRMNNEFDNTR